MFQGTPQAIPRDVAPVKVTNRQVEYMLR